MGFGREEEEEVSVGKFSVVFFHGLDVPAEEEEAASGQALAV